jgi:hypothetical protein
MRQRGHMREFKGLIASDAQVQAWLGEYQILTEAAPEQARLERFVLARPAGARGAAPTH